MPFEPSPSTSAKINTRDNPSVLYTQREFAYGVYGFNGFNVGIIDYAALYPAYVKFKPTRSIMPQSSTAMIIGDEINHLKLAMVNVTSDIKSHPAVGYINHGMKYERKLCSRLNSIRQDATILASFKTKRRRNNSPKRHQNAHMVTGDGRSKARHLRGGAAKPGKFKARFR